MTGEYPKHANRHRPSVRVTVGETACPSTAAIDLDGRPIRGVTSVDFSIDNESLGLIKLELQAAFDVEAPASPMFAGNEIDVIHFVDGTKMNGEQLIRSLCEDEDKSS